MNLHKDRDAFKVLLQRISRETGHREDVLEKDYYVTLVLEELSVLQNEGLPAYFKGGTALYKALKKTNRFSEDIDLSVDTRGCSRTQNDKRLEQATKKYKSLKRDAGQGITNRSEVIPREFVFFDDIASSEPVARAYEIMQNQYVLTDEDRIPFSQVVEKVKTLKKKLF